MTDNKASQKGRGAGKAKNIGPGDSTPVPAQGETQASADTMRRDYAPLPPRKAKAVMQVKDLGQRFVNELNSMTKTSDTLANDREIDIAVERIEEAVMWAVKGITHGEA